jgi:hypothetical protein
MDRLVRNNTLLQEAFEDREFEELPPEEQEVMKNGGVAILQAVAALTEIEQQFSQRAQELKDPVDEMTVFASGALDLDEQQFRKAYNLVRDLQSEAAGLAAGGRGPSQLEEATLKAKARQLLRATLRAEQERPFRLMEPHLSLVRFQPVP